MYTCILYWFQGLSLNPAAKSMTKLPWSQPSMLGGLLLVYFYHGIPHICQQQAEHPWAPSIHAIYLMITTYLLFSGSIFHILSLLFK